MKKYLVLAAGLLIISCTKTETASQQTQSSIAEKETVFVENPAEEKPQAITENKTTTNHSEEGNQENGTEKPEN